MFLAFLVSNHFADQLIDILNTRLCLFGIFRFQFFHIPGFVYNLLQKFRNADNLYFTAHHLNKIHKWLDLCSTLAECRNIVCHFQCIIKTDICRRRIICHTV